MRISNLEEREFYITEAAGQMWSVKELERQINSFYYRRPLNAPGRMQGVKLPVRISKDQAIF